MANGRGGKGEGKGKGGGKGKGKGEGKGKGRGKGEGKGRGWMHGCNSPSEAEEEGHLGPLQLPGDGSGTLLATDRQEIHDATGVSAAVRFRDSWGCRMLTLSGPPDHLTEAKRMAMSRILASQRREAESQELADVKERLGAAELKISALQHQVSYLVGGAHPMQMYAVGAVPDDPPPGLPLQHVKREKPEAAVDEKAAAEAEPAAKAEGEESPDDDSASSSPPPPAPKAKPAAAQAPEQHARPAPFPTGLGQGGLKQESPAGFAKASGWLLPQPASLPAEHPAEQPAEQQAAKQAEQPAHEEAAEAPPAKRCKEEVPAESLLLGDRIDHGTAWLHAFET
ncbi:unnamed protein product [Symbiodinium microadriaticum]|nr:unnamed protein product [Symbiodinium microadriaticum]